MPQVVYRDQQLLIINKPSGLLSVPGRLPENKDSVALRLQRQFPDVKIVHRLDQGTSGLMVFALDTATHKALNRQFQERQVAKQYVARVHGLMLQREGQMDWPLICDWPNRPRQKVDYDEGKSALTHYRVLALAGDSTRVLLKPVTGRSHQLRVHLQTLGHPILGDGFYATGAALASADSLQLHAQWLAFRHPATGRPFDWFIPAPF